MRLQLKTRIASASARMLLVLPLALQPANAAEWAYETVDSAGGGKFSSLRMDSYGNAHVVYVDDAHHLLRYAFRDQRLNKWFTTTIDKSSGFASLVLDARQRPHVSYLDYGSGQLRYAAWTGSGWEKQSIQIRAKSIDYYTSIALDANQHPNITYYEYWGAGEDYRLHLRNVASNGKYWEVRTIDTTPGSGKFNSAASDSRGNPHVAYANVKAGNTSMRFARYTGTSWQIDILEGDGVPGYAVASAAMVLDKDNNPHITYTDITNRQVKYATRRGGKWQIETVSSIVQDAYPDRNGIALDASGNPFITYYDIGVGVLRLVYRSGSKWVSEVVDQNYAGFTSSIQIDRGVISITYADETGSGLKMARRSIEQSAADATTSSLALPRTAH